MLCAGCFQQGRHLVLAFTLGEFQQGARVIEPDFDIWVRTMPKQKADRFQVTVRYRSLEWQPSLSSGRLGLAPCSSSHWTL